MNTLQMQVMELDAHEMQVINGGDGELSRAAGWVVGAAFGVFVRFGKALYDDGGIMGEL